MWCPTKAAKYGVAICNMVGDGPHQLPLRVGDTVKISEECQGWYRGHITRTNSKKGIFPTSYIHLIPCGSDIEWPEDSPVPQREAIVSEVYYVLHEWHRVWKHLYMRRDSKLFDLIGRSMLEMIQCRSDMFQANLVTGQRQQIKTHLTTCIDTGNKRLGLDLVPRVHGEQVNSDSVSPVELFNIHEQSLESARKRDTKMFLPQIHHLQITVHSFEGCMGDEFEVLFGLFNTRTHKFFTEKFRLKLKPGSAAGEMERLLHNNSALFKDLGSQDLIEEVYLVANVYRLGSLRDNDSSRAPTTHYRRPYGCGVLSIKEILLSNMKAQLDGSNNHPDSSREDTLRIIFCGESEFPQHLDNLLRRGGTKGARGFNLSLSMRMLHGDLDLVKKENPVYFLNMAHAQKIGFGDVVRPDTVRNDLYITLAKGEFEKGSKSAHKNIEVRVMVLDQEGFLVNNCISPGGGSLMVTEHNSSVFYHNNYPTWNETITVRVPIEQFNGCHVRFEYRHCSSTRGNAEKKLFGFSFVKLTSNNQTTLCDCSHSLYVYKCDDPLRLRKVSNYIHLPEGPSPSYNQPQPASKIFGRNDKESLIVETTLCSTKLTQNVDLLGLLRWKDQTDHIDASLKKLMKADGEEIVKCLDDIMDALFTMFSPDNGVLIQAELIFKALVYVFNLMEEKKFVNFKPVLDNYIQTKLAAPLVFRDLMCCLKSVLELVVSSANAPSIQEDCQLTFKALSFITKCIIRSKQLFQLNPSVNEETRNSSNDTFMRLYEELMEKIVTMLALENNGIAKTQCILLDNVAVMLEHFSSIVPISSLSSAFTLIIETTRKPKGKKRSSDITMVTMAKLKCLKEVLQLEKFTCIDARSTLVPMCIGQLQRHLSHPPDLTLCAQILSILLDGFFHKETQQEELIAKVIDHLLKDLVQVILDLTAYCASKSHLVACLISILRLMNESRYRRFSCIFTSKHENKEFLIQKLRLFEIMMSTEVFHSDWVVMKLVMNNTILLTMQYISQILASQFLQPPDFDAGLWISFFKAAVSFLTQPGLQLEAFSEGKRNKIHNKYGDMRVLMGYEVLAMWQNLGSNKQYFMPNMVEPFLTMSMVRQEELRKTTIPIFFDMMASEWNQHASLKQFESIMADKLDLLIGKGLGDHAYCELLQTMLKERVGQQADTWLNEGSDFIYTITSLLRRLLDYRNLLEATDEHKNKKMTCTVNLLHFYQKEFHRPDLYIRYIYKLYAMHCSLGNHVEAGFTLMLHADALEWQDQPMCNADPLMNFPQQSTWQRKEALMELAREKFHLGKAWEYAISICKILAARYDGLYMYNKLSRILQKQSEYYNFILKEQRQNPHYFKVGFYGEGYPNFLRNKEFVYRGHEFERIINFQNRLLVEFDKAEVLGGTAHITEEMRQGKQQYIQLCGLSTVPPETYDNLPADVSENVRKFYKNNGVNTFTADKPFHKGTRDKENDFKTLHVERTTVKISSELPGILQWFMVISQSKEILTPVEVAVDTIRKKNDEIQDITRSTNSNSNPLNPLTMILNGVIDAAVSGGTAKYQEAFFSPEFVENNPSCSSFITALKAVLSDQVRVLGEALLLHKQRASADIQGLQSHLESCYTKLKKSIRDSGCHEFHEDDTSTRSSVVSQRSSSSSGVDPVCDAEDPPAYNTAPLIQQRPVTSLFTTRNQELNFNRPKSMELVRDKPEPSISSPLRPTPTPRKIKDNQDSGIGRPSLGEDGIYGNQAPDPSVHHGASEGKTSHLTCSQPPPLPTRASKLPPNIPQDMLPALPPKKRSGSVPNIITIPDLPKKGRSPSVGHHSPLQIPLPDKRTPPRGTSLVPSSGKSRFGGQRLEPLIDDCEIHETGSSMMDEEEDNAQVHESPSVKKPGLLGSLRRAVADKVKSPNKPS